MLAVKAAVTLVLLTAGVGWCQTSPTQSAATLQSCRVNHAASNDGVNLNRIWLQRVQAFLAKYPLETRDGIAYYRIVFPTGTVILVSQNLTPDHVQRLLDMRVDGKYLIPRSFHANPQLASLVKSRGSGPETASLPDGPGSPTKHDCETPAPAIPPFATTLASGSD